jgi:hypothetical protein
MGRISPNGRTEVCVTVLSSSADGFARERLNGHTRGHRGWQVVKSHYGKWSLPSATISSTDKMPDCPLILWNCLFL